MSVTTAGSLPYANFRAKHTESATEYSSAVPGPGGPAFQFSRMEKLFGGHRIRGVTVDGVNAVFVNDPSMIRTILVTDHRNYGRGELFRKGRNISKVGMLADNESVHRHFRRLANPFLRTSKVEEYDPAMRSIALRGTASWRAGHAVNIQAEMCRIAGSIAVRTLFPGLAAKTSAALSERFAALAWATIRLPIYGTAAARARRPGASSRRLARAHADVRDLTASCIADQLRFPDPAIGYLSALLSDSDEKGDRVLTLDQVCNEAILMLSAATVTTASVMSWALYELSADPLLEKKLIEDIENAGNGCAKRDIEGCPVSYTVRFLMEILRLYPPVWIHCRKTRSDVTLGDYSLPESTNVVFSPYLLHRDPDHYPDPHRLDPDRWLSVRPGTADDTLYIPFGIGPKGCTGQSFAWQELQIILGAVLQQWRLSTKHGSRVRVAAEIMLHPRQLLMIPRPR